MGSHLPRSEDFGIPLIDNVSQPCRKLESESNSGQILVILSIDDILCYNLETTSVGRRYSFFYEESDRPVLKMVLLLLLRLLLMSYDLSINHLKYIDITVK